MRRRTDSKETDQVLLGLNQAAEKQETDHGLLPDQSLSAQRAVVNVYWDRDDIVVMYRDGESGILESRLPAVYSSYLLASELDETNERKLRGWKHITAMRREGDYWRLDWKNFKIRRKACDKEGLFYCKDIDTFEADVSPVRRFLTDYKVSIARPKRCFLDLETDPRNSIEKTIKGKSRILCWAIVREDGTAVSGVLEADTDEAEIEMIKDLWVELSEFEQIIAWGGDTFDFEVMKERSLRLGMKVNRKRWLWLDHLGLFKRYNMSASESGDEKQSMSLEAVSQALLGVGKSDIQVSRGFDMWAEGGDERQKLVDYNVRDTHLMYRIEQKTGFIELHQEVCQVCHTLPDSRGSNPTNFVEGYLMRLGRINGVHFRTRFGNEHEELDKYGNRKVGFEGAYVMEPAETGLLKGIHVCDFASLYPSIIVTFNISPETYAPLVRLKESAETQPSYLSHLPLKTFPIPDGHCATPNDVAFRTDVEGILPRACSDLMRLRNVWKAKKNQCVPGTPEWKDADRRQSALKIAINSFYGVMGSPFSRFNDPVVAGAVTMTGQWLIKKTIAAAEERNSKGIYGDTDSVFIGDSSRVAFGEFVEFCNTDLYPKLLAGLKTVKNTIKLSYEKEFSHLVLVGKKRYAGRYAHYEGIDATEDSKPEIKGLEYKRGDTLKLTRDMQAELIDMLLFQQIESTDEYVEWAEEWKKRILEAELEVADITMSKKMSKRPKEYKVRDKKEGGKTARPAHVELAIIKNKEGADIRPGDRIPYIVTDASVSPMKVVHLDDFDGTYDRHYIWQNLVYPASQRVLEACYPGHKWGGAMLKTRPKKARKKKESTKADGSPGTVKRRRVKVIHSSTLPGIS